MKLIIDIPDDYVEEFKMQQEFLGTEFEDVIESPTGIVRYAIANGMPIDKCKENSCNTCSHKGYDCDNDFWIDCEQYDKGNKQ